MLDRGGSLGVAAAVLAALLLGACGGSSTTSGNPINPAGPATSTPGGGNAASVNACALVTQAQASQIVGTDVANISGSGAGVASTCAYASTTTGASMVLSITQVPTGAGQTVIQQALLNKSGLTTLSGVGDAAGESKDSNDVTIAFVKGQWFVVLGATSTTVSGADLAPRLESLAKSIAGHL